MKKSTLTFAILVTGLLATTQIFSACAGNERKTDESTVAADSVKHDEMKMDSTAMAYACPMHPEMTGKEGDTCSKCGMKLEAVKSADSTKHRH